MERLELSPAERRAIYAGNLARLCRLDQRERTWKALPSTLAA
jgi:hypothetical protein